MPFNSPKLYSVQPHGIRVTVGTADRYYVLDLPPGTTHVSCYPQAGSSAYNAILWPDPGTPDALTPDGASYGVAISSGAWFRLPVLRLDRPRLGISVTSADMTAHGGSPIIRVAPEVDPVVSILRSRS